MSLRTENSWVGMPRSRATSLERETETLWCEWHKYFTCFGSEIAPEFDTHAEAVRRNPLDPSSFEFYHFFNHSQCRAVADAVLWYHIAVLQHDGIPA